MTRLWERIQRLKPYRANQRYNEVRGNLLSAGIAYYAFFSIFPTAAIAAVVFGFVLRGNPGLLNRVGDALNEALPNFVKTASNPGGLVQLQEPSISLLTVGGAVAGVSLVLSGVGWIGSFRDGIRASLGAEGSPGNILTDKLRDFGVFVALGLAFLVSAALTSILGTATGWIAERVGLGGNTVVVYVVGLAVGYAVDVAVLVLLLRALSGLALPWPVVRQAALLGGLLLSVVKIFGTQLIATATKSPLLGPVALVVGLLFWLNLIARLVLLSACWAYIDIAAGQEGEAAAPAATGTIRHTTVRVIPPAGASGGVADPAVSKHRDRVSVVAGAVLGAAAATAVTGAVRRWRSR